MARVRKVKLVPRVPRAEQNRRRAAAEERTETLSADARAAPRFTILDRSKPYSIVSPPADGASFCQKGADGIDRYYDGTYRRVQTAFDVPEPTAKATVTALKPAAAGKSAAKGKAAPPPPEDDPDDIPEDERTAGMPAQPGTAATDADPGNPNVPDGEVNLTAWAEDPTVQYPWADVRAAIKERFAKVVTKETDALDLLVDEKVANPAEIARKWAA